MKRNINALVLTDQPEFVQVDISASINFCRRNDRFARLGLWFKEILQGRAFLSLLRDNNITLASLRQVVSLFNHDIECAFSVLSQEADLHVVVSSHWKLLQVNVEILELVELQELD